MANPMITMQTALIPSRQATSAGRLHEVDLPSDMAKNITASIPLPFELASIDPTIS